MLSSPRRPDTTIRIFSSAEYCLRVLRRISRTDLSAGSLLLIDFCPIFVPFAHYDEPEILRYAINSICPKGADVRHQSLVADGAQRQLLFELDRACVAVNRKSPETEEARLLLKTYGNLVRMWSRA